MQLHPVKSSNIKAVGYDPATKTLRVQFHSSGSYDFHQVAEHHHGKLMQADSPGKYFQAHIRHSHDFTKLEE